MRLSIILPVVKEGEFQEPTRCPYRGCKGRHFRLHQEVDKPLRDTVYPSVKARRYRCLWCKRTFRVYPTGVSRAQTSLRVQGLAVMLYLLGFSYGAVSLALGVYLCKSQVYLIVQEAARRIPGLSRQQVFEGIRTQAMDADVTSVRCRGQWLPLGLAVDENRGLVLSVDALSGEDAQSLQEWMAPIAQAVGAEVLVTDDADAFKQVADAVGLKHQVCKSHVKRNTDALVEALKPLAMQHADGSLAAIGVSSEQAVADLDRLRELVARRPVDGEKALEALYQRYAGATPPKRGETASVAYRIRCLLLDRWNLWKRLVMYRQWQGTRRATG